MLVGKVSEKFFTNALMIRAGEAKEEQAAELAAESVELVNALTSAGRQQMT